MKPSFPKKVPLTGRVRVCLELLLSQKIKNKIIVNVGSSFGWLEKEVIKYSPKKIIGVEPSHENVEFARKDIPKALFFEADALNIPVKDSFADIVTLFDVIEHVPKNSELSVLWEVNRVLKKKGILILSTPNSHPIAKILDLAWYFGHRHYSRKQLDLMFKNTGFEIVTIDAKGSLFSSLYLFWFYAIKKLTGNIQPRNKLLEKLDDEGYKSGKITDIFLIVKKIS